jgi:hypothetical protein
MAQQEGRLVHGPEYGYWLHQRHLHDGDPLDVLVGTQWIAGHVHDEPSDERWYCDAGIMSIPLYHGREARFRLELVHPRQDDEEALMLAAFGELGELSEEEKWDEEEFEDEQWD